MPNQLPNPTPGIGMAPAGGRSQARDWARIVRTFGRIMNAIVAALGILAASAVVFGDEPKKGDAAYRAILDHLEANGVFFWSGALAERISAATVWKEADEAWQAEMARLKKGIASYDKGRQDQILSSKQQVYIAWKRECRVFLDQLDENGAVLWRYVDRKNNVTGFVIISKTGKRYWLSL